jgi:hypothetical protein
LEETTSPDYANLFDINNKRPQLTEDEIQFFHHMVANPLFLCKRARPDIQIPIAFLIALVIEPDFDDIKKLSGETKYLDSIQGLAR